MLRYLPILLLALPTSVLAEDAPWATYRGGARRTGNTDGKAGPASAPQLEWAMKSDEHFVASPVPAGDAILFSAIGAFNRPNVLSLPASPKDAKAVKPTWNKTAPFLRLPTVSSPAVIGDKIIFGEGMHQTDGAVLYCLPADGGFLYWARNVPGELVHMEGSPAIANGKVYVGDEDGDFAVLASSKEKKVLTEVNLGYPVYGTPIVANGVMYVMNQSYLYAFQDSNKTAKDEVPKIDAK